MAIIRGVNYAQGLILLMTTCMLSVSLADTIIVGGTEQWRFGFNYTDWAFRNSPFYINDTLVFKYDPPNGNNQPQSVYLLPYLWNYLNCDLRRAELLANAAQGSGKGFKFVLSKVRPHYFASGEGDGHDCRVGLMKFAVLPIPRTFP